jgi:succinoglycan biosynthesis transport protein ExoP
MLAGQKIEAQGYNQPDQKLLGFADVVDFLQRRWKLIAGMALGMFVATIAVTMVLPPSYSGTTEILLETSQQNVPGAENIPANVLLSSSAVESQMAILKSQSLLTRVVRQLDLTKDPEFGAPVEPSWFDTYVKAPIRSVVALLKPGSPELQARDPISAAAAILWDKTTVARAGQSNVMRITVSTSGAQKSAKLANALADAYLKDQLEARYDRARRSSDWLNERQKVLQAALAKSEADVEAYRIKNNLVETPSGSLTEQQMSELSTALIKARAETAAKRSSVEQVRKLIASGGEVLSNPDIGRTPVIADLRAKLTAILPAEAEVRSRYGERHPDLLKLQAERRVIEDQLKRETDQAINNLSSELEAAEWREASLSQALASASSQSGAENQVSIELRELERIAAANKQIYESFLSRARIALEETTLPTTDARIISMAAVPDSPDFPRPKLFGALGLMMGALLGAGLAVLLELLRRGFMAQKQVEEVLDLPVLATIPRVPSWEKRGHGNQSGLLDDTELAYSRYGEAVRSLRFAIDMTAGNGGGRPRIIQVTSTMPGEGKTTLAVSLARSAAAAGELVLLVDADLRLGGASQIFGKSNAPGLVDVLTSTTDTAAAIHLDERTGIYILPAGSRAMNPPSLLDSDRMQELMRQAGSAFDRVIIDSPPVAVAVDSAILSRVADRVVFAVKWSDTAREAVSHAVSQLACPGRMAGIVLNMVDERKLPRYGRYLSLDSKAIAKYTAEVSAPAGTGRAGYPQAAARRS